MAKNVGSKTIVLFWFLREIHLTHLTIKMIMVINIVKNISRK